MCARCVCVCVCVQRDLRSLFSSLCYSCIHLVSFNLLYAFIFVCVCVSVCRSNNICVYRLFVSVCTRLFRLTANELRKYSYTASANTISVHKKSTQNKLPNSGDGAQSFCKLHRTAEWLLWHMLWSSAPFNKNTNLSVLKTAIVFPFKNTHKQLLRLFGNIRFALTRRLHVS